MWAHPGKQLLFMGDEFGQESEWAESRASSTGGCSTTPSTAGVQALVRDLNRVYRETPALWARDTDPAAFQWIDANDAARNVFSFVRRGTDGRTWCASPTSPPMPHEGYRLGLPVDRHLGRGAQHRRRVSTPAPGSATSARSRRPTASTPASRRTPTSGSRPSPPSGSASATDLPVDSASSAPDSCLAPVESVTRSPPDEPRRRNPARLDVGPGATRPDSGTTRRRVGVAVRLAR